MFSGKTTKKQAKRICPYCFAVLYRGCRHRCGALSRARNLIEQTSSLEKERIASHVINEKIDTCNEREDGLSTIKLRTFGRPATYAVAKGKAQKRRKITYDIIKRAKVAANLSVRQTNKFLAHLRHGTGKGFIVSRIRDKMTLTNKTFDADFVSEYVEMEIGTQECKTNKTSNNPRRNNLVMKHHPIVYVVDFNSFYEKILGQRSIVDRDNYFVKIGIDSGRGLLKVNISIVPKPGIKSDAEIPKFLEGFKLSGVKRLMIVACTPAKETSTNIRILFDKLKIETWLFSYKIVADMCCINKLCGLGNHKSKYPCYVCHWDALANQGKNRGAKKRTFGTLNGKANLIYN